jgi:uncharacterized protein involved in response to NO
MSLQCPKSNHEARKAAQGYFQLVGAGEPFRLLFPIGASLGIVGVMMWPSFIWKWTSLYPGQFHARVMIEGFLSSFVFGFLGTALPRLLGFKRVSLWETMMISAGLVAAVLFQLMGNMFWGDLIFWLTLTGFLGLLGYRTIKMRTDIPPPSFVLALLGLVCAWMGLGVQLLMLSGVSIPETAFSLSRLMFYQGYILFPILGVGAFLMPRFFGLPNHQSFPESISIPKGWTSQAGFALLCGAVMMTGFILEALNYARWGYACRTVAILVFFLKSVPIHRAEGKQGSLALGLKLSLASVILGYGLMAIFPQRSISFLHLIFVSGFSLVTLVIATRVVLGHSGQAAKFNIRIKSIITVIIFLIIAMLTRVSADWTPSIQWTHYAYAAVTWAAGVIVWMIAILPGVSRAGD